MFDAVLVELLATSPVVLVAVVYLRGVINARAVESQLRNDQQDGRLKTLETTQASHSIKIHSLEQSSRHRLPVRSANQ